MIVIEGPDGAGKSTLGSQLFERKKIVKLLPSPRLIVKGRTDMLFSESQKYLRMWGPNNWVAVDRFLFSEMVYGPILRKTSIFERGQYLMLLADLMSLNSPLIFCIPDKYNHKEDESHFVKQNMPEIIAKYKDLRDSVSAIYQNVYTYDWQKPDAWDNLMKFLRREKETCV
jgi:hypothetical protein